MRNWPFELHYYQTWLNITIFKKDTLFQNRFKTMLAHGIVIIKAWTQVLLRFKSCSPRVGDSRWWGSLTMVPAGNKAKWDWSVNHTTKTIHHHVFLCNSQQSTSLLLDDFKRINQINQSPWFKKISTFS